MNPKNLDKVNALLKEARKKLLILGLKGFLMAIASTIPVTAITVASGLLNTSFPFIAGFMTALLIHFRYIVPNAKQIGDSYAGKLKEALEEVRDQS